MSVGWDVGMAEVRWVSTWVKDINEPIICMLIQPFIHYQKPNAVIFRFRHSRPTSTSPLLWQIRNCSMLQYILAGTGMPLGTETKNFRFLWCPILPHTQLKMKGFSSASGLRTIPFRNYEVRGDLRIDVVGFMPFGTPRIAEWQQKKRRNKKHWLDFARKIKT